MQLSFRQGIVHAPAGFLLLDGNQVSLRFTENEYVSVTISDSGSNPASQTNYLFTETVQVEHAWAGPFQAGTDYWLYWDLDTTTGQRTFGHTLLEPVAQGVAPIDPANDQHWFDTASNNTKVWNETAGRWMRKVRVFACKLQGGAVPISMSINSTQPTLNFTGTQVGALVGQSGDAGGLLYDTFGNVIKKSDGTFFTTEDQAVAAVAETSQIKFASLIVSASAEIAMAAYTIVRFLDYDSIAPAYGSNLDKIAYGMILDSVGPTETTNVITQGIVQNDAWNFETMGWPINTPVYVGPDSQITNIVQPTPGVFGTVIGKNRILVRPASLFSDDNNVPTALDQLSDVTIVGAIAGQYLGFDGTNWANVNFPTFPTGETLDISLVSATAIPAGTAVALTSTGGLAIALADGSTSGEVFGLAGEDLTATEEGKIVTEGKLELTPAQWNIVAGGPLVPGTAYYLTAVSGHITATLPDTEGELLVRVGTAIDSTTLYVKPQTPIGL